MTDKVSAAYLALAGELAERTGAIIRRHFRQKITVEQKPDRTPVTAADREAEKAMREMIEARYPDHGIWGEEFGRVRPEADYVWVLDPIDGTKSFISGVPLFGTLISLAFKGKPVLGVIDQPISRERWVGAAGHATLMNGRHAKTRGCTALGDATLYATSPDMFEGADAAAFQRLRSAVKLARFGADCYAYGLLAGGFVDLVVESGLKPYDFCALAPVVEGAGGTMTDWQGKALSLQSDGRVVACGDPRLTETARAKLAK
jgi:inositol-phosphate phosphatase / L-galactose 1-phosphate phosphatase / histidinol-phosphatase